MMVFVFTVQTVRILYKKFNILLLNLNLKKYYFNIFKKKKKTITTLPK